MTTTRPVHGVGYIARQNNAFFLGARIWNGHRRKQGLRVGVFRLRVQLTRRRNFYNAAQIHHSNAIADVLTINYIGDGLRDAYDPRRVL